jgi:uncharacterized protein (TIGR03435 family)
MISFAVLAIVKATLVCGVAFFLSRVCRRTRASILHLIFALAFTALVAVPVAGPVLPTLSVTVPAMPSAPAPITQDMSSAVLSSVGVDPSGSSTRSVSRDTPPARSVSVAQLVTATWLIGVALFLIPVVVGFWQVRRLRRVAFASIDGQSLVQTLAPTLGVHRPIEALLHEGVTGPLTCGVLKPAIILPATAEQWDEATLRSALRHELEHVARWDFLTHCLSRIVCAVYWFHPLVWAAWRRLRLEAERACDDAVLHENDATDYASLLVSIAQRQPTDARQPLLAMAGRGDLAARVAAVLDNHQTRGRIGRRRATMLIVSGAIAILGVAPITAARAMPRTQGTGTAASPVRFETVSIKRNTGFGAPLARLTDGGLTATNVPVRHLLWVAYGPPIRVHQIDNAPGWIDSDRFDILAKAPTGATQWRSESSKMLQSLLADRFKLVAHLASRDLPAYALVLTRPIGSPGFHITRSQIDCSSKPGASSPCGLSGTAGRLAGRGVTMAQFVGILANHLGASNRIRFDRPVIDRTALSGAFDFSVEWTPDPVAREILAPSQSTPRLFEYKPYSFPLESNAPTFLKALQEQLGLKLDSQLSSQPVLVIDQIEPPTEN